MEISASVIAHILRTSVEQTADGSRSLYIELSSDLLHSDSASIDAILSYTFDTLGARILDMRIVPSDTMLATHND